MKKLIIILIGILILWIPSVSAQTWNVGMDIQKHYIWRGTKFGGKPNLQLRGETQFGKMEFGFVNYRTYGDGLNKFKELDLNLDYIIQFSETSIVTSSIIYYHFPEMEYTTQNFNYFEPNLQVNIQDKWKFFAGYISDFKDVGDIYAEIMLDGNLIDIIFGMGDGQYNPENGKFNVCNLTFQTTPTFYSDDVFNFSGLLSVTHNPRLHNWIWNFGLSITFGDLL